MCVENLWSSIVGLLFKSHFSAANWFLVMLFISVGAAPTIWGKWYALVWVRGSWNLRFNVAHSCSGQSISRFFKCLSPVVSHTSWRKQERNHFRLSYILYFDPAKYFILWISYIFHTCWYSYFRCHKAILCSRTTWCWTVHPSWNKIWWSNLKRQDCWSSRPWYVFLLGNQ